MRRALFVCLVAACGGSTTKTPAHPMAAAYDPKATVEVAREDVTFTSGEETVPGTVVHPTKGKWPAIVMFAGSGPTDRDWNSPLLESKNGSGKLVAEELARHGAVVLRFDKAAIGQNKLPLDKLAAETYVGEGQAAIALLRARPDVDPDRIFTLGNSEGGIHAMRTAVAAGPNIHGVILLASAGRSMRQIILAQVTDQFEAAVKHGDIPAEFAKKEVESLAQAFEDFAASKPVDPAKVSSIPGIQQLVKAIVNPAAATSARALLATDPAEVAAKLTVPVLVMNGLKDLQVDPELDAKRLAKALGAHGTLVLVPEANHVFKHEPLPIEELRAHMKRTQDAYNADDRVLDPTAVAAIEQWLADHSH